MRTTRVTPKFKAKKESSEKVKTCANVPGGCAAGESTQHAPSSSACDNKKASNKCGLPLEGHGWRCSCRPKHTVREKSATKVQRVRVHRLRATGGYALVHTNVHAEQRVNQCHENARVSITGSRSRTPPGRQRRYRSV
jgi:hypothetical protein